VRRIRPVSHDDKLSVVDHLDELRSRLIVSLAAFVVAWAAHHVAEPPVLEIMNAPLPDGKEPITLGPTEAFTTTLMNAPTSR
jgi:sec-independent protein translocase protein TatC